jgi:hypothetical protein
VLRHRHVISSLANERQDTFRNWTPLKEYTMEPRLNFYKSGPDAMKAMAGLEQQIAR